MEGEKDKHMNKDGKLSGKKEDKKFQKAECLIHFSHQRPNYQVMLPDVQGF